MVGAGAVDVHGDEASRSVVSFDRLRLRDYALLLAFSWLLGIGGALGRPLSGHDEPRVAGIARAMALSGDFATPRLNGRPFLEYPSLGYWPAAIGLRIAGRPSELAARLPIVLLGGVTVCLAAWAGSAVGGRRRGLAAGLLLQTTLGFPILQPRLLVDPTLVCFVTLSLAGFFRAWRCGSRPGAVCFWLGMAGGFLAKGLVGIGVPAVTALGFLAARGARAWRRRDGAIVLRPIGWIWGPFLLAAPIALWVWAVEQSGGERLAAEVVQQSLHRFAAEHADHAGPWYEYLLRLPYQTLPLLPIVLADLWASRRHGDRAAPALEDDFLLGAAWFGLTLAALSAAAAKRALYLGPLYPGAALAGAALFERVRARLGSLRPWIYAWLALAAVESVAVGRFGARAETRGGGMRDLFAFVEAQRGQDPVVLYQPSEGLEGAAVFFSSRTIPEASTREAVASAIGDSHAAVVVADLGSAAGDPDVAPPGTAGRKLAEFALGSARAQVWKIEARKMEGR